MDAASNGQSPPALFEVQLMALCKSFNCLPSQMLEEDAALVFSMLHYDSIYNAIVTIQKAEGDAIHSLPASVGRIIASLQKQGLYKGGLSG